MNDPKNKTYEVPECVCPNCRIKMNRADFSNLTENPRPPQDGDVAVCMKCGAINEYKRDATFNLSMKPCSLDSFLDMTMQQCIEVMLVSVRLKMNKG